MSTLREQFTADLKTAMKAGEKGKVAAIRLIQSALKDKDIEARGAGRETASEAEILSLLQKMIKQRQESATVYEGAGRPELAAQEREEMAIIAEFQPQQLDEAETAAAVAAAVAETGASGPQDMGKVIAALRAAYAGRMDFGKVSGLVKAALTK